MATIDLGRIKFKWQGAYSASTAYVVDDVVESGGSSYVCILATTGNAPPNATYWELMADGGSPTTTQGDIIVRGASNDGRLAIGTAGGIIQMKQVEKTDRQSWNSTSEVQATNCEVSITPTSSSNKIYVLANIWTSNDTTSQTGYTLLKRKIGSGSYATIGNHTSDGSNGTKAHGHTGTFSGTWNMHGTNVAFLDNPATTSQCTYTWFARSENSNTQYINRTARHSTIYHPTTNTTITVMEIASGVL